MSEPVPLVSIIVPCYNAETFLGATLEAVIAQTFTDWECVVVDDASRDRTFDELSVAQKRTPNLRIVGHATHCGQSQAIISGVLASHGQWIVTLDGDGQNDTADAAKLIGARDARGAAAENTLFIGNRASRQQEDAKALASRLANAVHAFGPHLSIDSLPTAWHVLKQKLRRFAEGSCHHAASFRVSCCVGIRVRRSCARRQSRSTTVAYAERDPCTAGCRIPRRDQFRD